MSDPQLHLLLARIAELTARAEAAEAAIQRVRTVAAACYANDRYNASLVAVMRALHGGDSDA